MQAFRSSPVQPHVHPDGGGGVGVGAHGESQICTHSVNLSDGHAATHALRSSPVQPHVHAAGEGVGGAGVGGAGVGGVGAGAFTVPLVTQPPHPSSLGESTADFNQHSLLSCTQVKPAQPEVEVHLEQHSSALPVESAELFMLVPSLFLPGIMLHWPEGDGVGGEGGEGGCGPEHFEGSGPCTTDPEILRLETLKCDPSRSPGPPPHWSAGTHAPVHWLE